MSSIRGVKDRRFKFVQLLNSMFEDSKLSLKSKGFIGYCLTKPEDWKFHISHLCSVLKEGESAVYSTINECIDQGYAIRYQTRKEDGVFGEWETIISDSKFEIEVIKKELENDPDFQKSFTLRGFPDAVNPDVDIPPLSNTNKKVILEERDDDRVRARDDDQKKEKASKKEASGPTDLKGNPISLDESEIWRQMVRHNFPTHVVEEAIRRLKDQTSPITSVIRYVEQTCRQIMQAEQNKEFTSKKVDKNSTVKDTHPVDPNCKTVTWLEWAKERYALGERDFMGYDKFKHLFQE